MITLKQLDYPHAEELGSLQPWELQPSSQIRLDAICWLLQQIEPNWTTLINSRTESSFEDKVTYFCSLLGICLATDVDLIQGLRPADEQQQFFRLLLQLASAYRTPQNKSNLEITTIRDNAFLAKIIQEHGHRPPKTNKSYANRSQTQTSLFTTQPQLFPPDISFYATTQQSIPSVDDLSRDLTDLKEKLGLLTTIHNNLCHDPSMSGSFTRNLLPMSSALSSKDLSIVVPAIQPAPSDDSLPHTDANIQSTTSQNSLESFAAQTLFPNQQPLGVPFSTLTATLRQALSTMRTTAVSAASAIHTHMAMWLSPGFTPSPESAGTPASIGGVAQSVLAQLRTLQQLLNQLRALDTAVTDIAAAVSAAQHGAAHTSGAAAVIPLNSETFARLSVCSLRHLLSNHLSLSSQAVSQSLQHLLSPDSVHS